MDDLEKEMRAETLPYAGIVERSYTRLERLAEQDASTTGLLGLELIVPTEARALIVYRDQQAERIAELEAALVRCRAARESWTELAESLSEGEWHD